MTRWRRFSDWRFASKMLLLMGGLGLIAVSITSYALLSMRSASEQYRDLIAHEAQGALTIAEAASHLDSAGRLAYTVLTEPDEVRMLALLADLQGIKEQYDSQLAKLADVLPAKAGKIARIESESDKLFETAAKVITFASRWRGDTALQTIHREFEPSLRIVRSEMDAERDAALARFNLASEQLKHSAARTILITALAIVAALLLVIPLSVYVVTKQISRPISQLTRTMQRMSQRHYDDEITLGRRKDEVGQMANALQIFQRSMQREDRLSMEVAASAEARRLSEQLVDLTSAIPGAVFQMQMAPDGQRRILFASESAAQLHGRSIAALQHATEPAGHEFVTAAPQDVERAHAAFLHSARTLEPLDLDTEISHGNGLRWIKTLASVRRAANGEALFNGVWLDVTEQRKEAQALTLARNFAEKVADDKARFLATMSHEIRTPLNAMLGMTQLAVRHESDETQRQRIEKSLRAGMHLLNIVNDVLDISKIEAGKLVIDPEDFTAREWLEDLEDLLAGQAQDKGLALQWSISPNTPQRIRGDRQRMSQILINYASNAIKFTEAGSITISVDASAIDAPFVLLRCAVTDTGMGISEGDQGALFTAFAQADSSITRRFGGTGLGLAISRALAELMGGAAGLTSRPGEGSTFWFTARVAALPDAAGQVPRHRLGTPAVRVPLGGVKRRHGFRVLLVDDNELNRAVAHGMLEVAGITADEASDGAQALAMLDAAQDGYYALVLMDMQMPVMDGISAARALRQNARFAQLPVIALTANASEDDVARTREAGMNDHLSKPLLEGDLWRCLTRWLTLDAPASHSATPAFDATAVDALRDGLGAERANQLAATFLTDCAARLERLKAIAEAPQSVDWQALSREAHDLSGSAGSFGLTRLGDLAHHMRLCIDQRDDQAARRAIAELREHALSDLEILGNRLSNRAQTVARAENEFPLP